MRLTVLPVATICLHLSLVVPGHCALASHLTILPLAGIGVEAGPGLLALAVLLALLPSAFVERYAINSVRQLALTMALTSAPLSFVPRDTILGHIEALPVTLATMQ